MDDRPAGATVRAANSQHGHALPDHQSTTPTPAAAPPYRQTLIGRRAGVTGHIGGRPLAAPTVTRLAGLTLLVLAAATSLCPHAPDRPLLPPVPMTDGGAAQVAGRKRVSV